MLDRDDLNAIATSLGRVTRDYVTAAIATIKVRLDDFEIRLKAIPAGEKGEKGEPGPPGPSGQTGEAGSIGSTGPPGPIGERGEPGPTGQSGASGAQGEPGSPGERGAIGPKGETGLRGEPGISGIAGLDGRPGERGPVGPAGERGIPGEIGPRGEPGARGETGGIGITGLAGEKGERGIDGKDGRDGRDGFNGKDGRDGIDGKDALDIRILETIDLEKSYPQGTFARYRNGFWRALEKTQPGPIEKSGWGVISEGVYEIRAEFDADNPRRLMFDQYLSSGMIFRAVCLLPVLIYREVFREGETYEHGDVVTYGGCAWHCQTTTMLKPGNETKAWKLMVKEGRRGETGPAGKDGASGKNGRDGRDLTQMGFDGSKH